MKASSRLAAPRPSISFCGASQASTLPGVHQRDAVAAHPLVHEVGGDEDRHALVAREVDEQLPEAVAGDRVDARGGLVEDQELSARAGRRPPATAAARRPMRQLLRPARRGAARGRTARPARRCAPSPCRGGGDRGARARIEVLADRQLAVEREGLRHVAEVACAPPCCRPPRTCRTASPSPRWAAAGRSASSSWWTCRSRSSRGSRRSRRARWRSVTWSTAVKVPNRRVRPLASMAISALPVRRAAGSTSSRVARRASPPAAAR